ncbi:DoxX family protein [Streptomyces sp. LP05-1]|uniref:DoxX family protein n=1 Tax=Streptomyces pyxinae TaxID=2970734 RepID=A0ABT2CLW1_9ACTN|nr:DoxX family protein [Streptomyces sp. LP05-1]MCS0638409.1 DoxX family protein [Streptomyces sp. LP05-1]
MAILRKLARPLLASTFVTGGLNALRHPKELAPVAEPVTAPLTARIPLLPEDPAQLVRLSSGVQVGAGVLLALGRVPRLSALALAATLVPTTLAGHAFWAEEDPERRAQQRIHFFKNVALVGGLLIAAADTHGKPSLAHRSRRAATEGRRAARRSARTADRSARLAAGAVSARTGRAAARARSAAHTAGKRLPVG